MPLFAPVDICHDDGPDEPVRRKSKSTGTRCPVCYNPEPKWLYVDDYGDVAGCDDCLRVEMVEEP